MSANPTPNRLTRDKSNGMVGGVCSGIAAKYGFDVGLVRLVTVLVAVLTSGVGVIAYVAAWLILPAADAAPPASMGDRRREFSGEVAAAADRAAEAAKIAAAHARQAADEIAAVARGVSQSTTTPSTPPAAEAPAPPAPPTAPASPAAWTPAPDVPSAAVP
ncbi:MAG: PspC domain-containing protein, partial [Dehalococcoidia bacterium]